MNLKAFTLLAIGFISVASTSLLAMTRRPQVQAPLPNLSLYFVDDTAVLELQNLHAAMRDTVAHWMGLGDSYALVGAFPETEACYRRVAQLAPDWPNAAYNWGLSLERLGRNREAIEQFERALELAYSAESRCWYRIGRNWLRLEEAESAEEAFRRCGSLPVGRYEMAKIMVRSGRVRDAMPILDALIEDSPQLMAPYLLRSRAAHLMGNEDLAVADRERWEQATGTLESDAAAFQGRLLVNNAVQYGLERDFLAAQRLLDQGETDRAVAVFEEYLRHHWEPTVLYQFVDIEYQRGKYERARALLEEQLDRDGPHPMVLERLGNAHDKLGNGTLAVQLWERVAAMHSRSALHKKLERYYREKGDLNRADHHRAQSVHDMGLEALRRQDLPAAEKQLEEAIALQPLRAETWFLLAEVRRRLGKNDARTRDIYAKCLELDPAHGLAAAVYQRILPSTPSIESNAQ